MSKPNHEDITELGNPRKPQRAEGAMMLRRMNESHTPVTEWALGFFRFAPQDNVLDIGCGGGATLARLSRLLPQGRLTGIDYSEVSVALTVELNAADLQSGKLRVVEGSVSAMPFADADFDKIITVESFYFWPDPVGDLREVCRVLKPGGTFLLVADIYQKPGLSAEAQRSIEKYNLHNPTPAQFEEMLAAAGFADVQIHTKPGTDWICVEGRR